MGKGIALAVILVAASFFVGGCRFGAPLLEGLGGANCNGCSGGPGKSNMIVRNWARDARKGEQFIDQYLFNYDINDPYRGDCLVGY
ncbi:MAG: hypothetical protein O2894_02910 [Planctomycetota bacterium]|nr:hypothetical protein [Planctomycetota bacterium]